MICFLSFRSIAGEDHELFLEKKFLGLHTYAKETFEITIQALGISGDTITTRLSGLGIRNRNGLYECLQFLGAIAVDVEPSDLSFLVPALPVRQSMERNWSAIAPLLTRIPPDQLFDNMERAAMKVVAAKPVDYQPDPEDKAALREFYRRHNVAEEAAVKEMEKYGISVPARRL